MWTKFAKFEPLYSLNAYVSCFRKVIGQKSENFRAYLKEIERHGGPNEQQYKRVKRFFSLEALVPHWLRPFYYHLAFGNRKFHLITLERTTDPVIKEGNYYAMKRIFD